MRIEIIVSKINITRIQSFPDDYLFWGAYLKTYMQIGNAVPTMMARGIASVIREYLV